MIILLLLILLSTIYFYLCWQGVRDSCAAEDESRFFDSIDGPVSCIQIIPSESAALEILDDLDRVVAMIFGDFSYWLYLLQSYATDPDEQLTVHPNLFSCTSCSDLHSYDHWLRVAAYSVYLAEPIPFAAHSTARRAIIIAAVAHDACRHSDHKCDQHGRDAAQMLPGFWAWLRRHHPADCPSDDDCRAIETACAQHTGAGLRASIQPQPALLTRILLTADRLDRPRANVGPVRAAYVWSFESGGAPAIGERCRTSRLLSNVAVTPAGFVMDPPTSTQAVRDGRHRPFTDRVPHADTISEQYEPIVKRFIASYGRKRVDGMLAEWFERMGWKLQFRAQVVGEGECTNDDSDIS